MFFVKRSEVYGEVHCAKYFKDTSANLLRESFVVAITQIARKLHQSQDFKSQVAKNLRFIEILHMFMSALIN